MTGNPNQTVLEKSANRYPVYLFLQKAAYWGPVFFLYFNSILTLSDVLLLESVYYISVVILEIPTGYLADRLGPRRILIGSSLAQITACVAFIGSDLFAILALGQVSLAFAMALGSGSDTAYHFSVLSRLGRADQYGQREAKASRTILLSQASSALLGGAVAIIDLRLAYILTAISAAMAMGVALRFAEIEPENNVKESMIHQVGSCLRDATNPRLAWVLVYFIYMTVINHIPHEFYQPVIAALLRQHESALPTPFMTGLHTSLTMAVASIGAAYSIRLRDKVGPAPTLLIAGIVQTIIITGMATVQSPVIAILIVLRSVPRGLITAPLNAEVLPLIGEARRATYLSVQSLLGRLAFGAVLFGFSSYYVGDDILNPLRAAMAAAVLGWVTLALGAVAVRKQHHNQP